MAPFFHMLMSLGWVSFNTPVSLIFLCIFLCDSFLLSSLYGKLYLSSLWGQATCCSFKWTGFLLTPAGPCTSGLTLASGVCPVDERLLVDQNAPSEPAQNAES